MVDEDEDEKEEYVEQRRAFALEQAIGFANSATEFADGTPVTASAIVRIAETFCNFLKGTHANG